MGLNFVAIDFETANSLRNSACALGMVKVENGETSRKEWYIKPEPCDFDPFNVMIHGITEDMVQNAPSFPEVWNEVLPELTSSVVVAHNASFDFSVIRYTLDQYDLPYPDIRYLCTLKLAQKVVPGLLNYKLPTVASELDIQFKHHNAVDDAYAASMILMNVLDESGYASIDDLTKAYDISYGRIHPDGYRPCSVAKKYISEDLRTLQPHISEFNEENMFYKKTVVFTGSLSGFTRKEAAQKVVDAGGFVENGVNQQTDFLVLGTQDYSRLVDGKASSKMKKALKMHENGHHIQLISEGDFWENLFS